MPSSLFNIPTPTIFTLFFIIFIFKFKICAVYLIISTQTSHFSTAFWPLNLNMPYDVFTLKHNPDKVDPKYFEILLKQYNLDNSNVIYFEHSQEAVDSAKSLGITSYFYDSDKRDLVALKEFLDSNC